MKVFADNCQVCGQEELSSDLKLISLGSTQKKELNICLSCENLHLALENYKAAAQLILQSFDESKGNGEF